jgi:nucleoside-diphosphate-sugar epimerase
MKKILVCGSSGFVGMNLIDKLKQNNCYIVGVDIKPAEYDTLFKPDEFIRCDLRDKKNCTFIMKDIEEIYQLASDTGNNRYIESHQISYIRNNSMINLNILDSASRFGVKKITHIFDKTEHVLNKFLKWIYNVYSKEKCIDTTVISFPKMFGKYSNIFGERNNEIAEFMFNFITNKTTGIKLISNSYVFVDDCINYILKDIATNEYFLSDEKLTYFINNKTDLPINTTFNWIKDYGRYKA